MTMTKEQLLLSIAAKCVKYAGLTSSSGDNIFSNDRFGDEIGDDEIGEAVLEYYSDLCEKAATDDTAVTECIDALKDDVQNLLDNLKDIVIHPLYKKIDIIKEHLL